MNRKPNKHTMKKPEITPGPWNLKTLHGSTNGQIYGKNGEKIAKPLCFFMFDSEVKANGKAIAALPDLLEALERAVSIIEDLPHPENIPAQDLRQALVKAGYTFD